MIHTVSQGLASRTLRTQGPVQQEYALVFLHMSAQPEFKTHCSSIFSMRILQLSLVLMYLLKLSQASTGDRDFAFQQCVTNCETTGCVTLEPVTASKACHAACPAITGRCVPLILQLFNWSCQDDCRYDSCLPRSPSIIINQHCSVRSCCAQL